MTSNRPSVEQPSGNVELGKGTPMMQKTTPLPVRQKKHCDEFVAAEFLGLQVATLRDWRLHKRDPVFCKFGKAVRYPIADLEKYADALQGTDGCVDAARVLQSLWCPVSCS